MHSFFVKFKASLTNLSTFITSKRTIDNLEKVKWNYIYVYILTTLVDNEKKKLSHSILYFPTSFEHRLVFEGGIFKNKKLQKLREFISFILSQMFDVVTTTILTSL